MRGKNEVGSCQGAKYCATILDVRNYEPGCNSIDSNVEEFSSMYILDKNNYLNVQ